MKKNLINKFPKLAKWILDHILPFHTHHHALGDYEEIFLRIVGDENSLKANCWLWSQILRSILPFIVNTIYWRIAMFKNYIRIAFRNLVKQKMYSFITVIGLAVGLGVFLFFFRFFWWALAADQFHQDADRIYTVVQVFEAGSEDDKQTTEINYPLMSLLEDGIPEIEEVTRMYWPGTMILSAGDHLFYERNIYFADPNFLTFFSFRSLIGNPTEMLSGNQSIVLTENSAVKYFGDENPIGKILTLNNKIDVTVTGVMEETYKSESESSISFNFLISMDVVNQIFGPAHGNSSDNQTGFVRLIKDADLDLVEKKMDVVRQQYYPDNSESPKKIYLYPITEIIYDTFHIDNYYGSNSFIGYLFFLIIGILFLLIVCFNYVNLSTARYTERLKEVGLRKVVGASRSQLIAQFLGESVLLSFLAFPLAALFFSMASSLFSLHVGVDFSLKLWSHPVTVIIFIIITILTGILGGMYPAFFLSSFKPVDTLKNKCNQKGGKNRLRRFLVVMQLAISALFIVMSIVWKQQADFINELDLGYDRHDVLVVRISDDAQDHIQLLKDSFKQLPIVAEISASYSIPGNWKTRGEIYEESKTEIDRWSTYVYSVDESFVDVLDVEILSGRNFSEERQDQTNYIVSKMMLDQLGWDNAIGEKLTVDGQLGTIIGVSGNCYFTNLFYPEEPVVFKIEQEEINYLLLELAGSKDLASYVPQMEEKWLTILPEIPFEWFTLDDYFENRDLDNITLISEVVGFVGMIAIFFSCLGLLGLAAYATRQRTKEIGIRKVLGASISGILSILGSSFLKLVLVSNLVASPIAYFSTKTLLQFAYKKHVTIGADVFIITALLLLLTALGAVITQTLKAAKANPVESLKYE